MTRKTPVNGAADRLAKLLESWKVIALFIVGCVLLGYRLDTWQASMARAEDVQRLDGRVGVVESSLKDLKTDLHMIRQQLVEIAVTVGARQVAPAPRGNLP